jgi:hypothetical protein
VYESVIREVELPAKYDIVIREVPVPPRYETVYKEVEVPARYRDVVREEVIPGHYEDRVVAVPPAVVVEPHKPLLDIDLDFGKHKKHDHDR